MEIVIEFAKLLVPAGLVLYAMFLTIKSFINKEREEKLIALKEKHAENLVPIRLQAYERIVLLLERIAPNNLIVRLRDSQYSAREFQELLNKEIREEFNHNLSQQVYMSDESWNLVKNAIEEIIALINNAATQLSGEATSLDLSKKIFNIMMEQGIDPVSHPLKYVKEEIRSTF